MICISIEEDPLYELLLDVCNLNVFFLGGFVLQLNGVMYRYGA